ncbi:3'-5' exonuclease [Parahypoxylon ruwenzoriense]
MAQELSSNWKKLQATIRAESKGVSPSPSSALKAATKRKSDNLPSQFLAKRQKVQESAKGRQQQRPPGPPKPIAKPKMGVTQSSAVTKGTPATITPSLALWAEDNDVSPEDLAEAYNLGLKNNASLTAAEQPRVNEGLAPNMEVGKYVAMDCEMVGVGPGGHESTLARVSIVDFHGRQVYDSFVQPRERVTDWRTSITGITPKIIATGRPFKDVQEAVAGLIQGRILVGHDVQHDLSVLELSFPKQQTRDTARFSGYRQYGHGRKPALRVLARELLGIEIQAGHHSSIEDARVTMLLFRRRKSDFDVENAKKFGLPATRKTTATPKNSSNDKGLSAKTKAKAKAKGKKKKKKH